MATCSLNVPLRKRIGRACDQCRRRKTKCDGELKCKTCREVGLDKHGAHRVSRPSCPEKRLELTDGVDVVHLEKKLKDLKNQLRRQSVSSIVNDDNGVPELDNETSSTSPDFPPLDQLDSAISTSFDQDWVKAIGLPPLYEPADDLVEIIDSVREDETSTGDGIPLAYRGKSTGVEVVRNLRRLCDSFVPSTLNPNHSAMKMVNALDRSFPIHYLSLDSMTGICLPSESQVHRWVDIAFTEAFTLWPLIDRRLFNFHMQRLLNQKNFGREKGDHDNLALIHIVLALGQRYDPDLVPLGGECFESGEVRGIEHFSAARDLVGLTECSRSVTSVQTVLCMCIYLKSVSALRMVHTYVSMAGYAAHQLGLHTAASARHLPLRERVIRQRVYIALRIMDTYVTSSLGLPRNVRVIEPAGDSTNAIPPDLPESFQVADANMQLLEILGETVEKAYFTEAITRNDGSTAVRYKKLREVGRKLERWERRYPGFAQIADDSLAACTRSQLLLRYSKCFVLLMLYGPFMHHVVTPTENRSPNAYACGAKCIEAAIQAVRTAMALDIRGIFNEAYPLTVDTLAMAATALLVVELGAPEDVTADTVRRTSGNAKTLLEGLAQKNSTAAQCLESLAPLYQQLSGTAPSATATIEQVMQDFTLFTTDNSEYPLFNSPLDPFNPNLFVENPPRDLIETFNYPTIWID